MKRGSFLAMLVFPMMAMTIAVADVPAIAPKVAAQLVAEGKAVLVDVREPSEWTETGVAEPAVLLPKSDFDGNQKLWKKFLEEKGEKQVILYCRSGRRSGLIAAALSEQHVSAANAGSFKDWAEAGLPVATWPKEKPKSK